MDPIERILQNTTASLADGSFVRLVLSRPTPAGSGAPRVLARCVDVKEGVCLSVTHRHATRDETRNLPLDELAEWLPAQLRTQYANALLGTTRRDWQFSRAADGICRLVSHKPATREAPPREHDRRRRTLLDDSATDWLHGLGVTDAEGHVRPSMQGKHAQITRYVEILSHVAGACGWGPKSTGEAGPPPVLVDMGCGKGYLTFGAWHLFRRAWGLPVRVVGVEAREELVATTSALAARIGAEGLEFVSGTIDTAPLPPFDALIALHACDTATDEAILRGVAQGAGLILVAPCCHRQVRPQLACAPPLADVLQHGILAERMAEWATDGLRVLFLEAAGYRTRAFEFVATEHTPKNLMIAAIRRRTPRADADGREKVEAFKAFFGIREHALDPVLSS